MTDPPLDENDCRSATGFVELRAEIERLRTRIAQLESEKAALLRAGIERDYERPPHYL